jgi:signal peptidase II
MATFVAGMKPGTRIAAMPQMSSNREYTMRRVPLSRPAIFLLIAALGCLVDLTTKWWIFDRLGMPGGQTWWYWEPYIGVQTSTNEGALFGMGQGKVWLFAAASGVAIVAISWWLFFMGAAQDWLLTIALGVIMGGVLGNLHDRLGLWRPPGAPDLRIHAVRDWILFQWPPFVWPNFNIADSLLVCGGGLLVWHALTQTGGAKEQTNASGQRP